MLECDASSLSGHVGADKLNWEIPAHFCYTAPALIVDGMIHGSTAPAAQASENKHQHLWCHPACE